MDKKVKSLADLISLAIVAICSSQRECNECGVYCEIERLGLGLNNAQITALTEHILAIRSGFQAAKC